MSRAHSHVANGLLAATSLASIAAALSAVDAALVRIVSAEVHPFAIGFFRSAFGLLAVLPWIVSRSAMAGSHYRGLHCVRAGIKLLSLVSFYAAFASAELADATAIMFTAPIFLTLGAWAILGERLTPVRVVGIAVGFLGALIIIGPGGAEPSPALVFALLGAALIALAQLMLKAMSARDSTETLVAWNLVVTVPLALLPAVLVWTTPSPEIFALLALQGGLGAANMALMTRAFGLADASLVAPIDFLRLPLVAALALALFGEVPGASTWIGAAIIVTAASTVWTHDRLSRFAVRRP